jgi:hypothetical protein
MPQRNLHEEVLRAYILHLTLRDALLPPHTLATDELLLRLQADLEMYKVIRDTRYLNARTSIPKSGSLHLAWIYAQEPQHHHLFKQMLRISPHAFDILHDLIKDHPVFHNNSNVPQAPVDYQLAVLLYRMGRYGNGASLVDIAHIAGCSEGSVENWSYHCIIAIESLHDIFVCPLTPEEKEAEKAWIDQTMGFQGLWCEGWVMYDGTIVVLYAHPGMDGDAYYTHKSNYGLNLQVCESLAEFLNKMSNVFSDWQCTLNTSYC